MTYKQQGGMASSSVREGAVAPVPERADGVVFPYRGIENHGVKPDTPPPAYIDDQWPESDEEPHYVQGPTEDEPLPVRIVNSGFRSEFQDFRSFTAYVPSANAQTQNSPAIICGRIDPMQSNKRLVHIQNQSSSKAIFIGSTNDVSPQNGYRIAANSELPYPLTTESEIYGVSEDGTICQVGVLVEFSIEV